MTESVKRPHDKLFRAVFSDPAEAESFLRAYLPKAETERLDWTTLALVETNFVDESMAESESDLLYTVRVKETEQMVNLYILFEHQSSPDRWMRFRLLKYMCRIWDESFKAESDQAALIPILPLVFYQGREAWTYSTEFADLFPESERDHNFMPRFVHHLIDQSGALPEQIQGAQKARIAQLLMMAAFQKSVKKSVGPSGAIDGPGGADRRHRLRQSLRRISGDNSRTTHCAGVCRDDQSASREDWRRYVDLR